MCMGSARKALLPPRPSFCNPGNNRYQRETGRALNGVPRLTTRTRRASRTTVVDDFPSTEICTIVCRPCTAPCVAAHAAASCGTGGGGTWSGSLPMT